MSDIRSADTGGSRVTVIERVPCPDKIPPGDTDLVEADRLPKAPPPAKVHYPFFSPGGAVP